MVGKEYVETNVVGEAYCAGDEDKLFRFFEIKGT